MNHVYLIWFFVLKLPFSITKIWYAYVYPILLCAICVIVCDLRPEFFGFGQPNVFTSNVTRITRHSFYTPGIPRGD